VRRQAPSSCPVCQSPLRIARLECDSCHTAIEGDFDHGRFARLTREQLSFALVFLECRGKIKDVEERLGLSYPTVVSRLEQVVAAQTVPPPHEPAHTNERRLDDVLEDVARGKLNPAEAAAKLRAAKKKNG
jgi:hypothetical protein